MSKKIIVLSLFLSVMLFFPAILTISSYVNLEHIQQSSKQLRLFSEKHALITASFFMLFYFVAATFSLPGVSAISLLGGFLFGRYYGTILVSLSSTLGATSAFLCARFLFQGRQRNKYQIIVKKFQAHLDRDGVQYLFALRMTPAIPFFLVNVVMGLTNMPPVSFAFVSLLGMLPMSFIYVSAGEKLSEISSLQEILSFDIALLFFGIGLIPLVGKRLLSRMNNRE